MNQQLESQLAEFLSTTSYDEVPRDWQSASDENDNDDWLDFLHRPVGKASLARLIKVLKK